MLTYSHSGGENTSDSFNMQVVDDGGGEGNVLSDAATIQLDIVPNNDDPLLNTNVPQTMAPGSSSITLTAAMLEVTDVDSANTSLTYTLTSVPNPADGYFTVNGQTLTAGATFTQADINAGNVSYVTLSDTPRTDSMTFTVKDGGIRLFPDSRDGGIYDNPTQGSPLTPITFDVIVPDTVIVSPDPVPSAAPINTSPVSGGSNTIDAADLNEGGTFNFSDTELLITDAESSADELVYRLVSLPTSGFISLNGASLTYNQTFTQADVNNGNVSFVHNGDEDFVDSFNYTLSDGNTESAPQSFSIAVTPQNDTPEAVNNNAVFVSENNVVVITDANIILSDRDNSASDNEGGVHAANDELSFRITADTLHGELRLDGVLITANTTVVTLAQLQNGDLTYTHSGSENFSDSFSLVPLDDSGVVVPTATNASSEGSTLIVPITIFPANDATTFVSKRQLIAGEAGAVVEGGSRVIGGAQSYATINGVSGSGLPTPDPNLSNAHLVFGDDDNSSIQRQYRITDAPNNGRLFLNTTALGVGSVFTQDDLDSGRISYQHDGTETSNDSFDYVVSDGDWTSNDSVSVAQGLPSPPGSTFLIEITPTNDIAEISGPDNLDVFAVGAATTAVPVVTLADLDLDDGITAGETDFMRIEVSVLGTGANLLNYTAADPSSFVSGKGTDTMILQGTKAEIDAVLASLTIAFSADLDDDNLILRVIADDRLYNNSGSLLTGANGGPINDDGSAINAANNRVVHDIALRASNSNDVPVISNASSFAVNEDEEIILGGFALSDVDSFGEDVTATVELFNDAGRTTLASSTNEGRLRLSSQPGIVIAGNNSNTLTITGNITDVENALNALRFQGRGDFNGPGLGNGTLYLTTTIADFDHADGQQTATVDNDITITPVNDAPVLAINATLTNGLSLDSGTSININAEGGSFTLNDNRDTSEGAADLISVSVAATNTVGGASYGTLTATTSGGAIISNDNTATITITGTAADVEATLNSLVYTPTDANVDTVVRIRTTADDRDGGVGNGTEGVGVDGNNTDSEDFFIEVSGTNDAPVITLPVNPTVLEDSTANAISGISISDTDDFGSDLQVSLSLAGTPKGTINLSTIAGLTLALAMALTIPRWCLPAPKRPLILHWLR
ncbi:MAG: cadherin-like domain-containing protein [Porticoccaceae bacterium]